MRKYRIIAQRDEEGPDDLYEMKQGVSQWGLFGDGWAIADIQQLPRDDETTVEPVTNRFADVDPIATDIEVDVRDGVVYYDGEAVGQYSDADEETRDIIDEKLGENREWRQLNP